MECQFEEKQFEQHLNNALLRDKRLLYPPGQVLENTLGIDAALFTTNRDFWRVFNDANMWIPWRQIRPGVFMDPKWWKGLEDNIKYFPKFKFNVFLQHKRPEYLLRSTASEWEYWGSPYFRYDIVGHQQETLEELEIKVGGNGIVAYASPAFYGLENLWDSILHKTIVRQTNFAQVTKVSGHDAYTYISPGNKGKGFSSEPTDIESYDFEERLQSLFSSNTFFDSNNDFIDELGIIVQEIMMRHLEYRPLFNEITGVLSDEIGQSRLALGLIRVDTFCFLTNTTWKIGIDQL
jgi:hypothetical protein